MSELRKDPVTEHWVVIAPERGSFPWPMPAEEPSAPDELNPFVEGHEAFTPPELWAVRAPGTAPNTPGWSVCVVPNRFPALRVEGELAPAGVGVFDQINGIGAHEVIVESPDASMDWPDMGPGQLQRVLLAYSDRIRDLRHDVRLRYHTVFRCHGRAAGATLSHPLSQLVGLPIIPPLPMAKLRSARTHFRAKERCLFADLIAQEQRLEKRVVLQSERFIVLAPYASRSPFELVIYPLRQCHDIVLMSDDERFELASVLIKVLGRLRTALNDPPYHLQLFTAPNTTPRPGRTDMWSSLEVDYRWHLEILPQLGPPGGFAAATGCFVNPVPPEEATAYLRGLNGGSA